MPSVSENGRRLIVAPKVGAATGTNNWLLLIPIWVASATIMSGMLGVFFLIALFTTPASAAGPLAKQPEVVTIDTRENSEQPEPDLTNETLGQDSNLTPNRNIDNIDKFTAPGEVNPMEVAGILNGTDNIKRDIPPPPGTGGGTGRVADTGIPGVGNFAGTPGGMGGIYNPGGVGGRTGSTKEKMLEEYGGNGESEAAVARGLAWLAMHQAPDGHWSLNKFPEHGRDKTGQAVGSSGCGCTGTTNRHNDTAATAMALLPFLGAGHTHRPLAGSKQTDYSKTVLAGLNYLMKIQNREGYLGGDTEVNNMYGHAIATIALCEAYGMTNDSSLRPYAQRAVTFIVNAQSTEEASKGGGGWRYVSKQAGDTSVTGWMIQALKSGQLAGLSVPPKTFTAADEYLDKCKSEFKSESDPEKKLVGYSYTPGSGPTRSMTAVALLCREYMGVNPKNPDLLRGIEYLKEQPPGAPNGLYYEYYATQVLHHMGGPTWQFWNLGPDGSGKGGIRDTLIKKQDRGTDSKHVHQAGSWAPQGGGHVNDGGRIMWTSLSLLTLEVYYRHLPLYSKDLGTMKESPK